LGIADGLNLYSYSHHAPGTLVDHWGLDSAHVDRDWISDVFEGINLFPNAEAASFDPGSPQYIDHLRDAFVLNDAHRGLYLIEHERQMEQEHKKAMREFHCRYYGQGMCLGELGEAVVEGIAIHKGIGLASKVLGSIGAAASIRIEKIAIMEGAYMTPYTFSYHVGDLRVGGTLLNTGRNWEKLIETNFKVGDFVNPYGGIDASTVALEQRVSPILIGRDYTLAWGESGQAGGWWNRADDMTAGINWALDREANAVAIEWGNKMDARVFTYLPPNRTIIIGKGNPALPLPGGREQIFIPHMSPGDLNKWGTPKMILQNFSQVWNIDPVAF
jgi:hypothetical protein